MARLLVLQVLRSWCLCMLSGCICSSRWPACCYRGAGAAEGQLVLKRPSPLHLQGKVEGDKKEEANKEEATKEKQPTPEPAVPEQRSIQLRGKLLPSGAVLGVLLCAGTLAAAFGHQACPCMPSGAQHLQRCYAARMTRLPCGPMR